MYHDLQPRPLFVPFQKRITVENLSLHEQYVMRAVKASLIAFLIAVTLVGYATNRYEEKAREAKAAALTCQPTTSPTANQASSNPRQAVSQRPFQTKE